MRSSVERNVFIKHVDKEIKSGDLHDTFSLVGKVLSCKVQYSVKQNGGTTKCENKTSWAYLNLFQGLLNSIIDPRSNKCTRTTVWSTTYTTIHQNKYVNDR